MARQGRGKRTSRCHDISTSCCSNCLATLIRPGSKADFIAPSHKPRLRRVDQGRPLVSSRRVRQRWRPRPAHLTSDRGFDDEDPRTAKASASESGTQTGRGPRKPGSSATAVASCFSRRLGRPPPSPSPPSPPPSSWHAHSGKKARGSMGLPATAKCLRALATSRSIWPAATRPSSTASAASPCSGLRAATKTTS